MHIELVGTRGSKFNGLPSTHDNSVHHIKSVSVLRKGVEGKSDLEFYNDRRGPNKYDGTKSTATLYNIRFGTGKLVFETNANSSRWNGVPISIKATGGDFDGIDVDIKDDGIRICYDVRKEYSATDIKKAIEDHDLGFHFNVIEASGTYNTEGYGASDMFKGGTDQYEGIPFLTVHGDEIQHLHDLNIPQSNGMWYRVLNLDTDNTGKIARYLVTYT